jgi:hypothetical protein
MIEKNLGNFERVVRLVIGVCFAVWTLSQPHLGITEWFVGIISLMLILNGVFSRCYLWYLIEVDTTSRCKA